MQRSRLAQEGVFHPLRSPIPEVVVLLSVMFPGAGHLAMGLYRRGALTALGFATSCGVAWGMASGRIPAAWVDDREIFFCCCWAAVSLMFFAVADAWETARAGGIERSPNPRVAFILNFCTRGLGYFYVERPWMGCACLVGMPVALRFAPREPWGDPTPWILVVQTLLAAHAYALATRSQADTPPAVRVAPSPVRAIWPALILVLAAWLSTQGLIQADGRFEARLEGAPQAVDRLVTLPRAGVSLTLPTQDWRFRDDFDQDFAALVSRRARIVVMSVQAPTNGLDGYIVNLAADLTRRYGTVRLRGQHDLAAAERRTRELCYEWTDGEYLCTSRMYLVECGRVIKTFVIDAPEPLDEAVHAEVEAVVRSVRLIRHN